VAFACEQLGVSEHRACKLIALDRSSYCYEPRSDHNLGAETGVGESDASETAVWIPPIACPADQAWVSGERAARVSALQSRGPDGSAAQPQAGGGLASRAIESGMGAGFRIGFCLARGRGIRVLTVVDTFRRENPPLEVEVSLSTRRVTWP